MRQLDNQVSLCTMMPPAFGQSNYDVQLCGQGSGNERIAACTRLIHSRQLTPRYQAAAYASRGTAYAKTGALDQALADFTAALNIEPNLADAYYNRGKVYYHMGEYNQALAGFNISIQLTPNDTWNYNERGITYAGLGRFEDARHDLEMALTLDPYNQSARRNLRILSSLYEPSIDQSSPSEEGLKPVSTFANDLCGTLTTGSRSRMEISGEIGGSLQFLANIVRWVAPNLFARMTAKYGTERWEGPVQEDIAQILVAQMNCRIEIVRLFR
jgi:tetratricopeptide (TPR) repeat protein